MGAIELQFIFYDQYSIYEMKNIKTLFENKGHCFCQYNILSKFVRTLCKCQGFFFKERLNYLCNTSERCLSL